MTVADRSSRDIGGAERVSRSKISDERLDRTVTDAERLEAFRNMFYQSSLPNLPSIEGYHVCWLTTENPRDTIAMRMRIGYEPVKPEEIPGWEHVSIKTGEYAGFIGVNEMLAFKLPLSLYERYMVESHHAEPMRKEAGIVRLTDDMSAQARSAGARVDEEDGFADIRQNLGKRPKFDIS